MQDLTSLKTHTSVLEESLQHLTVQLSEAHEELAASKSIVPSVAPADPVLEARLSQLEAELATSHAAAATAKAAAMQAEENASLNIESISKMHDIELTSREEDHQHSLSSLKNQLGSTQDAHQSEIAALRKKLTAAEEASKASLNRSTSSVASPASSGDIAALHAAHQAKLQQVEAMANSKIEALEMVSV